VNRAIDLILPVLTASVAAFGLSPLVARLAILLGAVDMPGPRKIHDRPVPRLGGLAVIAACAVGLYVAGIRPFGDLLTRELAFGLAVGLVPIFAISLVDDIRGVRAGYKFTAHAIGAVIAVGLGVSLGEQVHFFGATIYLGWLRIPLSIFWIMGITNAFNIIDGLDGLSAGLALISAVAMAAVFVLVGQTTTGGAVLILAGALVGFLPYNMYPARLFLGDTGATAIGFCLAGFALKGGSTLSAGFAALVPVFTMGLPIADTLISMLRRMIGRLENSTGGLFTADKNHIHHRVLALGIDHRKAVFILYGTGFVLAAAAFLSVFMRAREAALVVAALVVAGFIGLGRLGYDEFAVIRRGMFLKMYEAPVLRRGLFVGFIDLAMVVVAVYLAVGLKTDDWMLVQQRRQTFAMAGLLAPLAAVTFWRFGLYKGSWKLATVDDYVTACLAAMTTAAIGLFVYSFSPVGDHYLTTFLIYGLISVAMVCGSRASYRIFFSHHQRANLDGRPALIFGADASGARAVDELFNYPASGLKPVGFIDDDPTKNGRTVVGLPVLGGLAQLAGIVERVGAKVIVLASDAIPLDKVRRTLEFCGRADVRVYRMNLKFEPMGLDAEQVTFSNAVALSVGQVFNFDTAVSNSGAALGQDRRSPITAARVVRSPKCPRCASGRMHRSHTHNALERFRRSYSTKRLYRCSECGWRGWLLPLEFGETPGVARIEILDLTSLDMVTSIAEPTAKGSSVVKL